MAMDLFDQIYELIYILYYNPCHTENMFQYENAADNLFFILDYHLKRNPEHFIPCLSHYCQMVIYIRNIYWGQGRRLAFYVLLYTLHSRYPQLAFRIMDSLYATEVDTEDDIKGASFCDLKYFCQYVANRSGTRKHPLILYFYNIVVSRLQSSSQSASQSSSQPASQSSTTPNILLSKWIPRESGSYAWIFHGLCRQYRKIDFTMNHRLFRQLFQSNNAVTPAHARPSMRSPGSILKQMMRIISRNTIIHGSLQDEIHLLCIEWELLETTIRKSNLLPHDTIVFLDLNYFNDSTLFDMMAWGYLLSLTSSLCKRFFVSTTIANWFNFEHCQNLYDIANAMIPITKHYSRVSCDPAISILLLQQSLLETNFNDSVANFRLAFLFANDSYDKSYIQRLTSLWNYNTCTKHLERTQRTQCTQRTQRTQPKWLFWNFCHSHFYEENPIDIHSTNTQTVSGTYPSTYTDVFSSQSSIQRLLSHIQTVEFPPITTIALDLSRNF